MGNLDSDPDTEYITLKTQNNVYPYPGTPNPESQKKREEECAKVRGREVEGKVQRGERKRKIDQSRSITAYTSPPPPPSPPRRS